MSAFGFHGRRASWLVSSLVVVVLERNLLLIEEQRSSLISLLFAPACFDLGFPAQFFRFHAGSDIRPTDTAWYGSFHRCLLAETSLLNEIT